MKNAPEMQEITPEYVMQLGQELIDAVLEATPADQVMKHFTAEERLAGLDLKEHLAALDPKDRLAGLDLKDRLAGLTPDQIRRYLEQLEKSNPQ
ncbi:MAG: hypothetical protein U1F76_10605 [Candidatus Competibacteraceae bacterium]